MQIWLSNKRRNVKAFLSYLKQTSKQTPDCLGR